MATIGRNRARGAFTLIDTAVAVAAVGIVAAGVTTMLGESRRSGQMQACQARLGAIGAGSAQFALTHNGYSAGLLSEENGRGTSQVHADEALNILRTRGRPDMPPVITGWVPDIGYWSLSLVEFQDRALSDPFNICPSHDIQNKWRRWPQAFDQGVFGQNQPAPSDVNKRWPYNSTYRQSAGAFDRNQNVPVTAGPAVTARLYQNANSHNLYNIPGQHNLGPSLESSVSFPAQKVHVFEEHQRHFPGLDLYFMYNDARANTLFFDGSVRAPLSGDARTGWIPNFPTSQLETQVFYNPARWEPPVQNPKPNPTSQLVNDSYRWTRDGLLGWDFTN